MNFMVQNKDFSPDPDVCREDRNDRRYVRNDNRCHFEGGTAEKS